MTLRRPRLFGGELDDAELEEHAEDVLAEPPLGDLAVPDGVDADASHSPCAPLGAVPMNGPVWVPLLVKRTMTLSPAVKTSFTSRCIPVKAPEALAAANSL